MLKVFQVNSKVCTLDSKQPKLHTINPKTNLQTITIPHHDFDHIKKVVPTNTVIRVLSESGLIYIVSLTDNVHESSPNENYLLDTTDPELNNRKLIVDDVSSFSKGALYLVHDATDPKKTYLYGSGENYYNILGQNCQGQGVREQFTRLFTPVSDGSGHTPVITHIGTCFSFSIMVLDYTDIYMSGQDWIGSNIPINWTALQFKSPKRIKKVEGASFQFVIIFEDDTAMFCGDNNSNQMPCRKGTLHFVMDQSDIKYEEAFGGFDCMVLKRKSFEHENIEKYFLNGKQSKTNNLKELLKDLNEFSQVDWSNSMIRFGKEYFLINFHNDEGLFTVIKNNLVSGFQIDIGKVWKRNVQEHYQVVSSTTAVVFYKTTINSVIYPKLFTALKNKNITDCLIREHNYNC